jgi:uncharacterized protein
MILEYIKLYFKELISLTNEMSPYLMLGFLFAGILHVFFEKEKVAKLLGSNKIKSSIYASLIGVPLPLCSCGVIPTGISFYKSGASKGSTVSFLISTPQTGVDSIMATYSMLGLPFAVLRPLIAFISGVFGGTLTNYLDRNTVPEPQKIFTQKDKKNENPFKRLFFYAFYEFLQDIAKWLIIGLLIAAFISMILPDDFFHEYINNDFLSMLIILTVSVPLYVCATGSIPIAAVLIMKGISPGAAFVFLMAGPATNAATITVLGKVMGKKALIGYLTSIILSSLFFGFLIDQFLPREWFTAFHVHGQHDMSHGLPFWFEITSSSLLILLILNIYIRKIILRWKSKIKPTFGTQQFDNTLSVSEYFYIKVKGLDCNNCKTNIEQGLGALQDIETVEADINTSVVKIKTTNFRPLLIEKTIESLGMKYEGPVIENSKIKAMDNYKIFVKGMSCNHCKANVERALQDIPGISGVKVELDQSMAFFEGNDLDLNMIKKSIESVGYEYGGIVS